MDIKVFKKACTLTFEFDHHNHTYGFLVNKTNGEFSKIEKFIHRASFEVDKDGVYEFILIYSHHLTIIDDQNFKIGERE